MRGGISYMKKFILMLLLLCTLSGCGGKASLETDVTDVEAKTEKDTQQSLDDVKYVWEKKDDVVINEIKTEIVQVPEGLVADGADELKTYYADVTGDGDKDYICIYKKDSKSLINVYDCAAKKEVKVFDKAMSFTDNQKGKLDGIFDEWFEERFDKEARSGYTRNGFDKISEESIEYSVVECNGENMICVTYLTEEMKKIEKMGDKLQVLLKYSDGEFSVYDTWLSYEYRFIKGFSNN